MQELVRCPACRAKLVQGNGELRCADPACCITYPVVNDVPVLINDSASVFSRAAIAGRVSPTTEPRWLRLKKRLDHALPTLGKNLGSKENFEHFGELLLERVSNPVVLVVGGRIPGQGFEALISQPAIRLVETDVSFGPRTQVVCDAHDLPFPNGAFDGVVIQAVLQYVADPARCVQEIERVLKPWGLVYSESAFMQQVVNGCCDFTRFTHLGVRRLFGRFRELRSGPVGGPGMALAWAAHYFLLSFASHKPARRAIHAVALLTLFWLKYFDPLLRNKPGTYDAASGFFFLGERAKHPLPDSQLVTLYRGAQ